MIREKYDIIVNEVAKSCAPGAKPPPIMAVTKTLDDAQIDGALACGIRLFGENRVQEAYGHWQSRRTAYPDLRLHLIGPLQTNKVDEAVALFDVIETLDRKKLVDALVVAQNKVNRVISTYIQVNIGEEEQKSGVIPAELPNLLAYAREKCLKVEGLMCIPPVNEASGPYFALLARLARRYGLAQLSMGMSGDYKVAAALGSTQVRVGTALFGTRT